MLTFCWYTFKELSVDQLYDLLALRSSVFVVDQRCVYLDPDGKDKNALHLLGEEEGELAAYIRLFPPDHFKKEIVFGRVIIAQSKRKKGYGKKLIEELLQYCDKYFPNIPIKCSAQYHLRKFYEDFGFEAHGEKYKEVGILHIAMQRNFVNEK